MLKKKIENFWYYHKVKVIVGIFAVVFIFLGWKFDKGGLSDLEIGYVIENHNFILEGKKVEEVKAAFESIIHDVDGEKTEKEEKDVLFVPLIGQRIELEFGLGICHILLLDKQTLTTFINNYFFEPLDSYAEKYNIDISNYPEVIADPLGTNEPKVYALPVKDMQLLLDMGLPEDFYLAIRLPNEKDKDDVLRVKNAHIVLDYILSESMSEK
ncbi:hypothetical protein [Acetivibrio saccincola]|jgi:hypothetical protein|uniref:Uncharacterized protein n=1 Tax=Acetivibrio saccincola TaxID=1677857 RepID=A0A2K9E4N2_9FIRM|nr:hypothetical protein [Acetivibrio saccincola]AUG58682.1 hypothetical protein HVS_14105 [Acetivibrio saccincola]NLW26394.1 hypothetical protein [Acetivibrio saccincola]PQQ66210.1 hypothetical protein B9R14_05225 [Acetivibrio saccincola]HOA97921.1 hypothetical protein [Acetivibrio saccincola]